MEDKELQEKIYEEIVSLKDLFLRRMLDDKVKTAAIQKLQESNDSLQKQLDQKAIISLVKEIILVCDRIDASAIDDDFTKSVKDELLSILEAREFCRMERSDIFDPSLHNAIKTEETDKYPEKSIIRYIRDGYYFRNYVFRPADVIVAVKKPDKL